MSIKKSKLYQYVNKNAAAIGLFIAIMAVSTAAIFIRKAQEQLPSLVIATYRLILATLFLAPFSIKKLNREKELINRKSMPYLAGAGVLLALHFTCWITSLEYTNVISSVVLVTTTPVWVTLFSPLFLNEKLPRSFTTGLVVALLGITIIPLSSICSLSLNGVQCTWETDFKAIEGLTGNVLAMLGAWCMAGYMIVGRRVRKTLSNQSYSFVVYAVAGITLLVISLLTKQPLLQVSPGNFVWLILLAIIPQNIGHSFLNWALGKLPAAYVSLSLLGEPVSSTLLALIFLSEQPAALEVLGSVIILFGIYWANRPSQITPDASQSEAML